MFCKNCGYEIKDQVNFCPKCGIKIMQLAECDDEKDEKEQKIETKSEIKGKYAPDNYACFAIRKILPSGSCSMMTLDGLATANLSKAVLDSIKGDHEWEINDIIWAKIKEPIPEQEGCYKVRAFNAAKPNTNLYDEFYNFAKRHQVGDLIRVPISKSTENYIEVMLGPTARERISKEKFDSLALFEKIRDDCTVLSVVVESISQNTDRKIEIVLSPENLKEREMKQIYDELPKDMFDRSIFVPKNVYAYLDEGVAEQISPKEELNEKSLRAYLDAPYQAEKSSHSLYAYQKHSNQTYYADFELNIKNSKGVPQAAFLKKEKRDQWVLSCIAPSNAERYFEKYVVVRDWQSLLDDLEDIILSGEEWDYGTPEEKGKKLILKQYLRFGFYKAWIDGLVYKEGEDAIFDTGLVDSSYDPVYCYLRRNSNAADFRKRKWEYGYFACRGKGQNGKEINKEFREFPSAPQYIDRSKIADLCYDPDKDLSCDYDHIIMDNVERLPYQFLRARTMHNPKAEVIIHEYDKTKSDNTLGELWKLIRCDKGENAETGATLRREIQTGLKEAVDVAVNFCRWNYKTAIPVYYAKSNGISLLLPLKLVKDNNSLADVALVVERLANGNYQGQTIFTMEMAYQDARQICRPNSDWLTPSSVRMLDKED